MVHYFVTGKLTLVILRAGFAFVSLWVNFLNH